MKNKNQDKLINHVALVIDDSPSMSGLVSKTREVVDSIINGLKDNSSGQETRLSIYVFGGVTKVIEFDISPNKAPAARNFIHACIPATALRDATATAILDLKEIPTKHGDHSFLIYVITDGEDNASIKNSTATRSLIEGLNDDWTIAVMVPSLIGVHHAKVCGFPAGNIEVWKTTEKGIEEVGQTIGDTYSGYLSMRSMGTKSTKSLFSFKSDITKKEVKTKLEEVDAGDYETLIVRPYYDGFAIKDFVESMTKKPYRVGSAYYQVTKPEKIQAGKMIAVVEKATGKMYSGLKARSLLGLPNYEVKVSPADFTKFDLYVQSTSTNRKLVGDTYLIVFK